MPKIDDLIRSHDKVGADKAFPNIAVENNCNGIHSSVTHSTVHDNLANQHYYVHISPIQILASRVIIDDGIYRTAKKKPRTLMAGWVLAHPLKSLPPPLERA